MSGLFEELKRRNVFKVGTAYVVLAWLLAQVIDVFLEPFGAPEWVIKTILLLLLIGFPVALLFAWAFELTPEGLKKEKDVDRSQSITHETGQKLNLAIIFILILALGYFAVDKFILEPGRHFETPEAAAVPAAKPGPATEKSIAVLPFVNMSDDAGNEYFSDGISEEILNALARVKDLKVAGRTSSFAFKGQNQDLRQIGEALGVNHILEGSVRKAGAKVRITAQLIQVDDGFHLWSDTYDRELTDVFAIQDEIANAILEQLKARLVGGESVAMAATRTSTEAYELYLLAKQRMYERTRLTIQSAADLLDKAIAIDPEYAPAYAQRGIATLLLSVTSYGTIPQDQALVQAKIYLDKALTLDQGLAEAWAGLGLYYTGPPPQPDKGIPVLEKALSINPSLNNAGNWLSMSYWSVNRATESMALLDSIAERDPLYKPAMGNRVYTMALMDRSEEARDYLDQLAPFLPGDPQLDGNRGWIDFMDGHVADGLRRMQSAVETQPTDRTFRAGVNWGNYLTHQYEKVFDDEWSDYVIWSLFNLGRNEEAVIIARQRAASGVVGPLFAFLNASGQSETLVRYFEDSWASLDAFQQAVPAHVFGYREMADIAFAYRRTGNQARFDEAMTALQSANAQTFSQGMRGADFLMVMAAYHAMAGNTGPALEWLAQAVDGGMIVSTRISKEYPYFSELDGDPEYEAIQSRMIEHLNAEREKLGLEPVST
jgi:TolB-like protein/Tfp pilus assembly protein PilF